MIRETSIIGIAITIGSTDIKPAATGPPNPTAKANPPTTTLRIIALRFFLSIDCGPKTYIFIPPPISRHQQNHSPKQSPVFHLIQHGVDLIESSRLDPAFNLGFRGKPQYFAQIFARTDGRPD